MGASFRDRLGSIIMLAFIAVLWSQRGYTTPFGGIFPDRILILMTVFVVITLVLSFTRYRAMGETDEPAPEEAEDRKWLEMWVVIAILLAWVFLLRTFGFALSGVLGFAFIAWYISGERDNWRTVAKALALGAGVTYLIIFIFSYLLKVPLPKGDIFG